MNKQEPTNKSETKKKSQILQKKPTQRDSELSGPELDSFQQIGAESSPESLVSILSTPELSNSVNASQIANMISRLQDTYGNAYLQRAIQAKLKIGQPGDIYEREADRVANAVMRMPESKTTEGTEKRLNRQPMEKEEIQIKQLSGQNSEITPGLESSINAIRVGGQQLSESTRTFFEPRFGYDFSQVHVHTDTQANTLSQALNARAFTVGQDIAFGAEQYAPRTSEGKRLLAHELTHVVQQRRNIQRAKVASDPKLQKTLEKEAETTAPGKDHYPFKAACYGIEDAIIQRQILRIEDPEFPQVIHGGMLKLNDTLMEYEWTVKFYVGEVYLSADGGKLLVSSKSFVDFNIGRGHTLRLYPGMYNLRNLELQLRDAPEDPSVWERIIRKILKPEAGGYVPRQPTASTGTRT